MISYLVSLIVMHIFTAEIIYRTSSATPCFQPENFEMLLNIFEETNSGTCKQVTIHSQHTTAVFESVLSELLCRQEESRVAPGSYVMTFPQSNKSVVALYKDYNRLLTGRYCAVGILDISIFQHEEEFGFFNLIKPKMPMYTVLRTDEDYFIFFTTEHKVKEKLLKSAKFQATFKYKVVVVIQSKIFNDKQASFKSGTKLFFQDLTNNLHGKTLRVSVPNYGSAIEMKLDNRQQLKATRGLYVLWMTEIEKKFNFTCEYFPSTSGTAGTLLENGKWSGGVGDVVNGLAHMSIDISHIFSREGVVEWASPFHYRGLVFVVHKARYHYPKGILLHAFTPALWSMFVAGVVVSALCFKILFKVGMMNTSSPNKNWSNQSIAGYFTATFLEQHWNLPKGIVKISSIRILITFWLFFAWVTATAYQAKLTSLMGFPEAGFVPNCFEELLDSDFRVGINALGKGESAYQAFISGGVDIYKGLFVKSAVYPNATECILKAVAENFACISGEGVAAYTIASSITFKNGENPLQFSDSKANFVEGGVIYQKRWIYRQQFDQTIRNAMNMGLIAKWWEWHMNSVRADKRKSDKLIKKGNHLTRAATSDDDDSNGLKIDKLVSCLVCCSTLLLVGFIIFCIEIRSTCFHFLLKCYR